MSDIDTGLFLGGVARQRNTNRELGLRERAIGVQENQLEFNRQTDQRNAVMEAIGKTTDQAVNLIQAATSRDQPGFSASLGQLRTSVEQLATQAEAAGIGITAASVLQNFDNLVLSTQTAGEKAQTEGEAAVTGAQATVEATQDLPAGDQAAVARLLGLSEPRQTGEFAGLLTMLEDSSLTPEQREFVTGRLNKLTQNNQLGLAFNVTPDGNISVAQVPASEAGLTSRMMGSASTLDQLRSQTDVLTRGISIASALINNTAPLGITADVRNVYERLTGAISDLVGVSPDDLAAQFEELKATVDHEEPEAFSIGELEAAEGFLLFSVARALQPTGERLLAATLDRARQLTDLGGVTSDEEVRQRLGTIVNILQSAEADVARRIQQSVSGTTEVERQPPLEASDPVAEAEGTLDTIEGIISELDRILGGG